MKNERAQLFTNLFLEKLLLRFATPYGYIALIVLITYWLWPYPLPSLFTGTLFVVNIVCLLLPVGVGYYGLFVRKIEKIVHMKNSIFAFMIAGVLLNFFVSAVTAWYLLCVVVDFIFSKP